MNLPIFLISIIGLLNLPRSTDKNLHPYFDLSEAQRFALLLHPILDLNGNASVPIVCYFAIDAVHMNQCSLLTHKSMTFHSEFS